MCAATVNWTLFTDITSPVHYVMHKSTIGYTSFARLVGSNLRALYCHLRLGRPFGFQPKGWCLSRSGNRSEHFRRYFAMGKIRGTPCMRSHIFVHLATTKYFSNSFVFKTEIEKEGLPGDITPALGAGGPRFKSGRPDH